MESLLFNWRVEPDELVTLYLPRTRSCLFISPFSENLYLNPLYSILGGSTTRQLPLEKKPILVVLRVLFLPQIYYRSHSAILPSIHKI